MVQLTDCRDKYDFQSDSLGDIPHKDQVGAKGGLRVLAPVRLDIDQPHGVRQTADRYRAGDQQ